MILGDLHRERHFSAAVAIVAMAFYTVLLPWHTVSQATGPPPSLGKSFEPPCHKVSAAGGKGEATALIPRLEPRLSEGRPVTHDAKSSVVNPL